MSCQRLVIFLAAGEFASAAAASKVAMASFKVSTSSSSTSSSTSPFSFSSTSRVTTLGSTYEMRRKFFFLSPGIKGFVLPRLPEDATQGGEISWKSG